MKFIHPTRAATIKTVCYVLAVFNSLLAASATLYNLPFIPPKIAIFWPVGYGVVFGVLTIAHVFGLNPDPAFQAKVAEAVQDGLKVIQAIGTARAQIAALQAPSTLAQAVPTNVAGLALQAESAALLVAPGLTPELSAINALAAQVATK